MMWALRLGLYAIAVVGLAAVAIVVIPIVLVMNGGASVYRRLTT